MMASCSPTDYDTSSTGQSWNCPLCLESYKCPKLLPCSHTYCEKCLKDLVKHNDPCRTSFACPSCRERIQVPTGGVSAFKNNFYIEAAREKQVTHKLLCKIHPEISRELELLCIQCDAYICLKCKIEDHSSHDTEPIEKVVDRKKAQVSDDKKGLYDTITRVTKRVEEYRSEQNNIRITREDIRKEILERHKMMLAAADKSRDDALFSLDTVTTSIDSELDDVVSKMQKCLDSLTKLKKRMEKCLEGEKGVGMLITAQEIYEDASKDAKNVEDVMVHQITTTSRPVLRFSNSADVILKTEQNLLGLVERVDVALAAPAPGVAVEELFRCASTCDVFSLFPRVDNFVWVAYEPSVMANVQSAKCPELFDDQGKFVELETSVSGRTSFTHTNNGTGMCIVQSRGTFSTYAKSRRLFKLKNNLDGSACIMAVVVETEDPLITHVENKFTFRCGPHRAFDMDINHVLAAVVEEAQAPETRRSVHLYQYPHVRPIATYTPPVREYQPSDVCFISLAGRQVLLVSDEMNSTIHVLDMENTNMRFLFYLGEGCPLIKQPKALNTDIHGRLWVACQGGSILLCH